MSSELTKRVTVAIIGIPVVLACIFLHDYLFIMLVSVIGAAAVNEVLHLKGGTSRRFRVISVITAIIVPIGFYLLGSGALMPFFLILILVIGIASVLTDIHSGHQGLLVTLFAFSLIIVPFSTLVLVRQTLGAMIIFMIFSGVWISDSAAFFVGRKIGRNKLAPDKSPNKSVEGAIGSLLGGILWFVLGGYWLLTDFSWQDRLILGGIVGLFSMIGDLLQSIVKRESGVKDSGRVFPGHGGVYDRFDSLVFVSGAVYLFLYFRHYLA